MPFLQLSILQRTIIFLLFEAIILSPYNAGSQTINASGNVLYKTIRNAYQSDWPEPVSSDGVFTIRKGKIKIFDTPPLKLRTFSYRDTVNHGKKAIYCQAIGNNEEDCMVFISTDRFPRIILFVFYRSEAIVYELFATD